MTDKQGIPLVMSEPVAGNHNALFDIENQFKKRRSDMQAVGLETDGLFMNADAGFDSKDFRKYCNQNGIIDNIDSNKRNAKTIDYEYLLDDKLYKERFAVESTNAWIEAFKTLLIRFETRVDTWQALHYLAFSIIFIRKHF